MTTKTEMRCKKCGSAQVWSMHIRHLNEKNRDDEMPGVFYCDGCDDIITELQDFTPVSQDTKGKAAPKKKGTKRTTKRPRPPAKRAAVVKKKLKG